MTASSGASPKAQGLSALSTLVFDLHDGETVLREAAKTVPGLGPCRTEAAYQLIGDSWQRSFCREGQDLELDQAIADCRGSGAVDIPGRAWGWAFPVRHRHSIVGTLVVSATNRPSNAHLQMLTVLANQTGAALACVVLRRQDERCTEQLQQATTELAGARRQLRSRTHVHKTIEAALAARNGEQAITDALHELTTLPVVLEDRFGNLRCWSGPGEPVPYPKPDAPRRQRLLSVLAARHGPMRMRDRVAVLVSPRGEHLGVLAIIDPRNLMTDEDIFALHFACTLLGYELSHQRSMVELEQSVRRELFDDLLAGTDNGSAVARAAALGHDLRRPHYVVVLDSSAGCDSMSGAAGRAVAALQLDSLRGRKGQSIVLLTSGRPEPQLLHRTVSKYLSPATCAIGIGTQCETPADVPRSFAEARRALSVRLNSSVPVGASAYDELGFYRLIDAAHSCGAVRDFIKEWLGALLDYDATKNSDFVFTLSEHLEKGGNYDDSAKALHIHRSTLRYRLARIGELTGYDLRDVDTRFNLHAATRAWRFLDAGSRH